LSPSIFCHGDIAVIARTAPNMRTVPVGRDVTLLPSIAALTILDPSVAVH